MEKILMIFNENKMKLKHLFMFNVFIFFLFLLNASFTMTYETSINGYLSTFFTGQEKSILLKLAFIIFSEEMFIFWKLLFIILSLFLLLLEMVAWYRLKGMKKAKDIKQN